MTPAQKLLEAHIQYELNLLNEDNIAKTLETEFNAVYDWFKTIKLQEISSPEQILEGVQRQFVETTVAEEWFELLKACDDTTYKYMNTNNVVLSMVLSRELFDQVMQPTEAKQEFRKKIVHQLVNSTIYTRLISDLLYTSLKNFMLSEDNVVTKRIPGASKILKFGQNFVNQNFAGVEENVEKLIKDFINRQIQDAIRQSENFLNKGIDQELMNQWKAELWDNLSDYEVTQLMDAVRSGNLDATADVLAKAWDELRNSELMGDLASEWVNVFFKRYGKKSFQAVLKKFGLTKAKWVAEHTRQVTPALQYAVENGYLEERLRAHLKPFYFSEEVDAILG